MGFNFVKSVLSDSDQVCILEGKAQHLLSKNCFQVYAYSLWIKSTNFKTVLWEFQLIILYYSLENSAIALRYVVLFLT